jgi:hypothetical protein
MNSKLPNYYSYRWACQLLLGPNTSYPLYLLGSNLCFLSFPGIVRMSDNIKPREQRQKKKKQQTCLEYVRDVTTLGALAAAASLQGLNCSSRSKTKGSPSLVENLRSRRATGIVIRGRRETPTRGVSQRSNSSGVPRRLPFGDASPGHPGSLNRCAPWPMGSLLPVRFTHLT